MQTLAKRGKKQVVPEGLYDALIAVVDLLQKMVRYNSARVDATRLVRVELEMGNSRRAESKRNPSHRKARLSSEFLVVSIIFSSLLQRVACVSSARDVSVFFRMFGVAVGALCACTYVKRLLLAVVSCLSLSLQDYLKDTKACLTNDFSRYKRALTSIRQELSDADSLAQVRKRSLRRRGEAAFRIIVTFPTSLGALVGEVGHPMFWLRLTGTFSSVQSSSTAGPPAPMLLSGSPTLGWRRVAEQYALRPCGRVWWDAMAELAVPEIKRWQHTRRDCAA